MTKDCHFCYKNVVEYPKNGERVFYTVYQTAIMLVQKGEEDRENFKEPIYYICDKCRRAHLRDWIKLAEGLRFLGSKE